MPRLQPFALVAIPLLGLAAGAALSWGAFDGLARTTWTVATLPVLLALLIQIIISLRRGDIGLDVVAALSMSAALVFGEPLAGNVVAVAGQSEALSCRGAERENQRPRWVLLKCAPHLVKTSSPCPRTP